MKSLVTLPQQVIQDPASLIFNAKEQA